MSDNQTNKQIFVAAKGLILNDKNEFLILKQDLKDGSHVWELPGGKVEFGESLKDCLVRETKEELQISIEVGKIVGTYQFIKVNDGKYVISVVFEAKLLEETEKITLDPEHTKLSEFKWISKEDFLNSNSNVSDPSFIEMLKEVSI